VELPLCIKLSRKIERLRISTHLKVTKRYPAYLDYGSQNFNRQENSPENKIIISILLCLSIVSFLTLLHNNRPNRAEIETSSCKIKAGTYPLVATINQVSKWFETL
jgi:hypothetical protein